MTRRRPGQQGFTLIEILLVIAVLGVLAGIVVFSVRDTTPRATESACAIERRTIRTALNSYRVDRGSYPTAVQGLGALESAGLLQATPDDAKWVYDPSGDVVGIGRCITLPGEATPTATGTVTVFAATSLTNAFGDIKAKLAAVAPDLKVTYSFAGSNALKAQINTGASPADVFAAADTLNAPNAPLVGSSQTFATNKLAIVTRPGNPAGVSALADLFVPGLQVVLCQTGVPCGTASNTAFGTLGKARGDLGANLRSEQANVGLVVSAVSSGAPNTVGIVYETDAAAAGSSLATVRIPAANNAVNQYPIYRISSGSNSAGAQAFISYVLSSEGQALLAARGFGPP